MFVVDTAPFLDSTPKTDTPVARPFLAVSGSTGIRAGVSSDTFSPGGTAFEQPSSGAYGDRSPSEEARPPSLLNER